MTQPEGFKRIKRLAATMIIPNLLVLIGPLFLTPQLLALCYMTSIALWVAILLRCPPLSLKLLLNNKEAPEEYREHYRAARIVTLQIIFISLLFLFSLPGSRPPDQMADSERTFHSKTALNSFPSSNITALKSELKGTLESLDAVLSELRQNLAEAYHRSSKTERSELIESLKTRNPKVAIDVSVLFLKEEQDPSL